MRIMALQTLSLLDRIMHHHAMAMLLRLLCMTGIAKVLHLFLQQVGILCDMGVVAGKTGSDRDRSMRYFVRKSPTIMAGQTLNLGSSQALTDQQEEHCGGEYQYRSSNMNQ